MSGVFDVYFGHVSRYNLLFWLLTLACKRLASITSCNHQQLHFHSSSSFGKSATIGTLVLWTKYYKKNSAKALQIALMLEVGTFRISYVFKFFSNFDFEFAFKCLNRCFRKVYFSTFVSSMSVDLSQFRGTVGVFHNRNIAFCNFRSIWYSQTFQNCSTFVFLMQFSYVQLIYLLF